MVYWTLNCSVDELCLVAQPHRQRSTPRTTKELSCRCVILVTTFFFFLYIFFLILWHMFLNFVTLCAFYFHLDHFYITMRAACAYTHLEVDRRYVCKCSCCRSFLLLIPNLFSVIQYIFTISNENIERVKDASGLMRMRACNLRELLRLGVVAVVADISKI